MAAGSKSENDVYNFDVVNDKIFDAKCYTIIFGLKIGNHMTEKPHRSIKKIVKQDFSITVYSIWLLIINLLYSVLQL